MFTVLHVLDKVRPSGTGFWIIDATTFELQAEIRINSKET